MIPKQQYKLSKKGVHAIQVKMPSINRAVTSTTKIPHIVVKSVLVNIAYKVKLSTMARVIKAATTTT